MVQSRTMARAIPAHGLAPEILITNLHQTSVDRAGMLAGVISWKWVVQSQVVLFLEPELVPFCRIRKTGPNLSAIRMLL